MVEVALVVGGGRILRGIVLWAVLPVVLWGVLWVVLPAVLLRIVTRLFFLSVASEWEEALLRWRGILVGVNLLLVRWGVDESHVGPRDPPSPVHGEGEEDRKHDHEAGDCDGNTCSGAQSVPANDIIERIVITVSLSHHGRR